MRSGLVQHLSLFFQHWQGVEEGNVMLLPIFQAEGRGGSLLPFGKFGIRAATRLRCPLELLQPAVAVGTLMSASSCCLILQQIQTLQSRPWLIVDFFALCSEFLSAHYQLGQGEAETKQNAHDAALCAAELS